VAPIALHPDPLLAQILMASTYPLEVVEAERWSQASSDLGREAREEALQKEAWDPSVKGLTAIPQTLQMMSDQPEWTQALGDAFLARQQAVLDAIQRLRARADALGNLETTPQQKVSRVAAPPSPGSMPGGGRLHHRASDPGRILPVIYDPRRYMDPGPIATIRQSPGIRPTMSPTARSRFRAV
jgi:hypothetical protein